jgi:hypothetical protein
VINLASHPRLFSGREVEFNNLKIDSFKIPIRDAKGKAIPLPEMDTVGKGIFNLSIKMAKPHSSHAGWIMKQASSLIGFGSVQFKARYMVLLDGVLHYYENEYSLETSRGTIKCSEIEHLNYGPDKNGDMTLQIQAGAEEWFIHWMDNETDANISAWLRKVNNCRPNNNPDHGIFAKRTESMSSLRSSNNFGLPVVEVKTTGKLQKRASILFTGGAKK